ncbi:AAA family ATPase [Streptomyces sp. NPDC090022]|uniref:AAA family ATPase n=1 Tax=Streptomyces sp. NPDC090022 TaxID=3365920 RepID=UPI0037FDCA02
MTQVLVVGVGDFDGHDEGDDADPLAPSNTLEELPSVGPAVVGLTVQLAKMPGLNVLGGEASHDPDIETLTRLWREALRRAQASAGAEALIVHFAGHGVAGPGDQTLFLASRETTRRNLPWTAAQVGTWLGEAEAVADGAPVLLLLDVCGAGRAVVQQLLDGIRAEDRRAWVIAACAPDEKTYQARFTVAAGMVLERLREGRLDISPAVEHVPVETLAREIDRELARSAAVEDRPSQSVLRTTHPEARAPVPSFLPNPSYRATAGGQFRQAVDLGLWQFATAVDPALDPLHFISRASGTPQQQDIAQGCFFTGRDAQLGAIKRWLEGPSEQTLMIVTGSPGSGKSALLGVVACLAHAQLREVSRQVAGAVGRDVRPELDDHLVAVHARQRGPSEILASIAAQLGLATDPGRGWSATALLNRITDHCSRPVTIVVDALDEASLDTALVEVLRELAHGRRRFDEEAPDRDLVLCRVLVGTRPWWDRYAELLEDLAADDQLARLDNSLPWGKKYVLLIKELRASGLLVDLDSISAEQRTAELTGYVCDVLETSRTYSGPGTAEIRKATAHAVAQQLGLRHKSGAFLLASLFAHYLVHQEVAPSAEEVVKKVPASLPAMLDLHLDVLQQEHPAMSAVLAAVAHGYGQGMPLEVVHSTAQAFVARGSKAPDLNDVRKALSAASFYLRFSTETDGQRLYRFYHQSLVDHLRTAHERGKRTDIFTCVLDTVPGPAEVTARRFGLALPYVLRHAAQHAVDARALDELLLSASYLVFCDPLLLHEHMQGRTVRGRIAALMSRAALSAVHEPWQRREWLRNTATVWGEAWLVEALDALDEPTAQRPRAAMLEFAWGTAEAPTEAAELEPVGNVDPVLVRHSQRWLAAGETYAGQLAVWDVRMGAFLFFLHMPDDAPLEMLCGAYGAFGALVAEGTPDGHVRVWDVNTGQVKITIETDAAPLSALGIVGQRGRALIVVCGGGEVTAYDMEGDRVASLDVIAGWLAGLEANGDVEDLFEPDMDVEGYDCTAVGATVLDGTEVYVAGAVDGAVHIWDADGKKHVVWAGGQKPITSLQILTGPGGPFVVTGAEDGNRVWDLRTGDSRLLEGVGRVGSGVVMLHDDTPCFAYFKGIEIRAQPLAGGPVTPDGVCQLPQGLGRIEALATDGTQWAAVGWMTCGKRPTSGERTALLSQSVRDGKTSLLPPTRHDSLVEHVAVARTVSHGWLPAVSVDEEGKLLAWDALTGRTIWSRSRDRVNAVKVGRLAGKSIVFLSQGVGSRSRIEFLEASNGRPFRASFTPRDTIQELSVDDASEVTRVVVRTRSGVYTLGFEEGELERTLYEEEDLEAGMADCSAWTRDGDNDVVVVAHTKERLVDSTWRTNRTLTVHSTTGVSRVLAEDTQAMVDLEIGRWGEHDAVVCGDEAGFIRVLCLETGRELAHFPAHTGGVWSVAFASKGEVPLLVTSGEDHRVRVWDPRDPGVVQEETVFPDSLGIIAVSEAGVFAGFGTRVAFFTWSDLADETD